MRKKLPTYTIDFFREEDRPPAVGQVFRRIGQRNTVVGYFRVASVRQVKVRVSRGEVARYAVQVERLNWFPEFGVAFTVWDNAPKRKTPDRDRFSPLL